MRKSKYTADIKRLVTTPFFTTEKAKELGISSRMLCYFCKKGVIGRVGRGVYSSNSIHLDIDFQWEDLVLTAMSIPKGVICLISALCYYNLTDQIMREFWIAIPHADRSPKRPHARIVRMRNVELGQVEICVGTHKVKIFDKERTVIDAFRYLSQEIAIKALRSYLQMSESHRPDLQKLTAYSKKLRVNLDPYIVALTT